MHHIARRRRLLIDALESRTLMASVANKLADINQTSGMLNPQYITQLGATNVTLFTASSYHGDGAELWRTDGTAAGTYRVKDINPGAAASDPSQLVSLNGAIYFTADDGSHGVELWKSDGTAAGTVLVKDVAAGSASGAPKNLIAGTTRLYFNSGTALWTSDGTDAGTNRVIAVDYTFATSKPFATIGDSLYFGAVQGVARIYKTDGTVAGTKELMSFDSTNAPRELAVFNGHVYFNADLSSNAKGDLWMTTDSVGTAAGAVMVKSIGSVQYSSISRITPSGNLFYFVSTEVTDGTYQLWRSDGTAANTFVISTTTNLVDRYTPLTPFGTNSLLFSGKHATLGNELYRSDGAAPYLVKDILAGSASGMTGGPVKIGSTYYVFAVRPDGASDLWKTDGTDAGTVRIADLGGKYVWGVGSGSTGMFFSLTSSSGNGELWKTDATTAGTVRVGSTNARGNMSSMWDYWTGNQGGKAFTAWGTSVLFSADDGINGAEVWISNPQTGVTRMIADVNPGMGSSNPSGFIVAADNSVLFNATRPDVGTELFRLLPSGQVQLVADVQTGVGGSNPFRLRAYGNSVFYSARVTEGGPYLMHRFDVSTLTNTAIRDSAGNRLAASTSLMAGPTQGFFGAKTENGFQYSLYQLSGAASTPTIIKTLEVSDTLLYTPSAVIGSTFYFVAKDSTTGYELWKSDGTISGTAIIKDINVGTGSADIDELVAFNNRLYFAATDNGSVAPKLWTSDGTAAGTVPFSTSVVNPYNFTTAGGNLFFVADTASGANVFRTDGVAAPAAIVTDSTSSFRPSSIYGTTSSLFYVMQDLTTEMTRYSLRQYTPATATTQFVMDLWVRNPFDPPMNSTWYVGRSAFLANGNRLYFPAFREEWGMEPHTYALAAIPTTIGGSVYLDRDRNGAYTGNDVPAGGVSVFVDFDNDGAADVDEPATVTNASGVYTFAGLEYGGYTVRAVMGAGQTVSGAAAAAVTTSTAAPSTTAPPLGIVDNVAPAVSSIAFDRNAPRMAVKVVFNDEISPATLGASDLTLSLLPGTPVSMAGQLATYDAATRTATFTFPTYANGMLPDGRYRARIEAGVVADAFGNISTGAMETAFAVLRGDANGDGGVNFDDLVILSQNYGTSGKNVSQGNFNYDPAGDVDFDDLVLLSQTYNVSLSQLAGLTTSPVTPAKAKGAKGRVPDVLR